MLEEDVMKNDPNSVSAESDERLVGARDTR
jgi:hypothetical protein